MIEIMVVCESHPADGGNAVEQAQRSDRLDPRLTNTRYPRAIAKSIGIDQKHFAVRDDRPFACQHACLNRAIPISISETVSAPA